MADEKPNLTVTPLEEVGSDFLEKYKDTIEKVNEDPNYAKWYETFKTNEKVIGSLNQSLLDFVFMDEHIPGEIQGSEYAYFDTRYQVPLGSTLLRNAGKTEGARLIKNRRRLQFTEFSRPSFDSKISGLSIVFEDEDYKPTGIEKANLKEFTLKFVDKFFFPPFERKADFAKWLGVCYEDFFDLDDITCEIRRTLNGVPLGFHISDPNLIFHVLPKKGPKYDNWMIGQTNPETQEFKPDQKLILQHMSESDIKYVMMKNNKRMAKFTDSRLFKSHFFRSSNYKEAYRGFSIVEQGIRMLMGIMKSLTFNSANFDNNRTPQGVFAFQGGIANRIATEQFKKVLYAYLSGAQNRHRLPVLGLPESGDAKFIPFNVNSREMEFHLWITLLFTILCQLSGTNPEEISMSSQQAAMTGKKLFDEKPDGILRVSRDNGLNTFLRYIESLINKSKVLQEMTGYNVKCKFNGLEQEDERVKIEVLNSKLASSASYNDVIEAEGGEKQQLIYGDLNIYDIKGVNSPMVGKVIDAKIEQSRSEIEMRKQQMEQAAQQTQQMGGTDEDVEMAKKHGMPEEEVA